MDAVFIGFLAVLWACTLVLTYGTGWLRGYDAAVEKHRWHRWMLKREQNRSHRF